MGLVMEITGKNVAIAVIPVLITALASIADNSLRWRAEMEQKQFDRQTRILDKIMEVPTAEKRLAVASFYLEIGVFTGRYKQEVNSAIDQAQREMTTKTVVSASPADMPAWSLPSSGKQIVLDPNLLRAFKSDLPPSFPIHQTREDIKSIFTFNKPLINKAP
ncbi:hypothetical protein D9M68_19220 [compost metagenome]